MPIVLNFRKENAKKVSNKLHILTCIDFIGTCIKVQSEYKKQINTHTALYIRFKIVLGILKELISIKYVNNKIMFIFL